MWRVTLLGTGGTMPLKNRWLSSCLLSYNGHSILTDCGEGTQIALKWAEQKSKPIDYICITHFHADHISGLPGFLLTLGNEGRTEPLTIVGPVGVAHYVKALCTLTPNLPFDIRCREVTNDTTVIQASSVEIRPFRVRHGIPCLGYSFMLPRAGQFDREKALQNGVPMKVWSRLQREETVELDGQRYTADMVLGPPRQGLKVTFTTDTRPTENIVRFAQDSDLFICEGMFGEADKRERALQTYHMLYTEAAQLALSAKVKRLWLTHFSPSMPEPEEYLPQAAAIFPSTECGFDGKSIELTYVEALSQPPAGEG